MGRSRTRRAPSLPETSFSTSPAFQYGVSGQTESGGAYQAGIQQSRTYNNTLFDAFNPYYLATLNLAVTQPLLKNLGMNATKRELKLAIVNADSGVAQTLVDASSTISQVEDDVLGSRRGVAQRRDPTRSAKGSDRAATKQRAARSARRGRADRRGRVADASVEFPGQPLHRVAARLGAAESAQEFHRRQRAGSTLERESGAVDFGRGTSERERPRDRRRARSSESAGGPPGRGQAACRCDRSRLCKKSGAAAGRSRKCSTRATVLPAFPRP